jgi:general secretion pathway protein F
MGTFTYCAIDAHGKTKKGTIEADTTKSVRQQLRSQGLNPLTVEAVSETSIRQQKQFSLFSPRISVPEIALMTRQFATMLNAGIPLEESLLSVAEQTDKPKIRSMIMTVRAKVLEGFTFAQALAEFPKVFDNLYRVTVAAGEKTGHLDTVLERLAEFTERRQQVRQKITQAMIYPSVIIIASLSMVSFLLTSVVPKMVAVFQQSGQVLPTPTRVLLIISAGLQASILYILIALLIGIILFIRGLKKPTFKARVDAFLLKLPIIGKTVQLVNTARFSHTFAILNSASVPILEAMRLSTDLVTSAPIRAALEYATKQVREGVSISRALKQTGYFPPMSIYLIASGENSGKLEEMLQRTAATQEKQVEQMISLILTLFEPLMILVMGGIVLFIVLAVLLPYFDIDQFIAK